MELAEELWDINENDEEYPLKKEFYSTISSAIKQYLSEYYGEKLLNLEPETYSYIETILKEGIDLYNHNLIESIAIHITIKDYDEFYKAMDNYVPDNRAVNWPVLENWFDWNYKELEDDEPFLEDVDEFELTENQRKAKDIVETADNLLYDAQCFNYFVRTGFKRVNSVVHSFLEENISFELSILSEEGFTELQKEIDNMICPVLEELYPLE